MKILFINPNMLVHKEYEPKDASFPLGLGYLASIAQQKGHEVQIIDSLLEGFHQHRTFNEMFNEWGLSDQQLVQKISQYQPDFVGIGCTFTSRWPIVKRLSANIKREHPNILVATGGIHPSNSPEEVLQESSIDFVVIGEGEVVFGQLLECIEDKDDFTAISGLGSKKNGEIYINKEVRFINDLDSIPFPARHLLPYKKYYQFNRNSVIATRGCPFNCVFCSMQAVMGWNFRTRSAENFVDEIRQVQQTYNAMFFSFDDDNLTLHGKFVLEFCNEIIGRGLKIYWNVPNGVNINSLTFEGLQLMKKAGCYSLCLAIESGDEGILKLMRKRVSLDKAREVAEWCRKLHIFTLAFFIIGMPGETMDTMKKTKDYALSLPIDAINVSIATPFPGTPFFEECKKKGYIKSCNHDKLNIHESNIDTELLTAEQVKQFQMDFLKDFDRSKSSPFTQDVLKRAVRNPGTVNFLERLRKDYFAKSKSEFQFK